MFIESNRLNQLNKNIFGHGLLQTKKLIPDSGRMVMPDPSLPKIKRYNIKSNNPLNYLLNANIQPPQQMAIPNPQESLLPPQESQNINPNEEELYSQKSHKSQIENIEIKEEPVAEPEPEPEQEIVPVAKKFVITDLGENNILLPPNYSTDDELEYKVINLINEPKENYELACENEYAKVYKKKVSLIILLLKYIYYFNIIFVGRKRNSIIKNLWNLAISYIQNNTNYNGYIMLGRLG